MNRKGGKHNIKYPLIALLIILIMLSIINLVIVADHNSRLPVNTETLKTSSFRATDPEKIVQDPKTGFYFEGGTVMVVAGRGVSKEELLTAISLIDGDLVGEVSALGVYEIALPHYDPYSLRAAIEKLKDLQLFEAVVPNYLFGPDQHELLPDVPQWRWFFNSSKRWGQEHINMPKAWPISTGEQNFKIAVIDSGFDLTHRDLNGNSVLIQVDEIYWKDKHNTDISHGTSVASVIGALEANNKGMAGIKWAPKIYCYQVTSFKDICAALLDAYNRGIRVVNISMGLGWKDAGINCETEICEEIMKGISGVRDLLEPFIKKAGLKTDLNRGMVVVTSAGNENAISADINYPGGFASEYGHVITVGAIGQEGNPTSFTSSGSAVSVAAPGAKIWMARKTRPILSDYHYNDGTSFSSPMVAGVAGLILSVNPGLAGEQVKQIIMDTAVPANFNLPLGTGVLDASAALKACGEWSDDSNGGRPVTDAETYEEIASFVERVTSYWPIDHVLPFFDDPGELDNDELILAMTLCDYTPKHSDEISSVVIRAEDLQKAAGEVFGPGIGDINHRSIFPFDWSAERKEYGIIGFGPGSYTEARVVGILETETAYIVDAVNILFYYTICYEFEDCTPEFYVHDEFGNFIADLSGEEDNPEAVEAYVPLFPVRRYILTRMEDKGYYISRSYMVNEEYEEDSRKDCFLSYLFMDIGQIKSIFGEPYEDGVRHGNYYLRFSSESDFGYHFAFDSATGKKVVLMSSSVQGENILGAKIGMTFADIEAIIGPGIVREGFRGYGYELHYEFHEVVEGTGNIEVNFRSREKDEPASSVEVRSIDVW